MFVKKISQYKKIITPIVILLVAVILMMLIFENPPKNERMQRSKSAQMVVATSKIEPQNYQVMIESFGTVKPRTQSVLFAQVSGQIKQVSPEFRDGGFFQQGDVLIQLDDRDHLAELNIAQASLMSAKQQLQEETARGAQAEANWKRLGNGKNATALVLRQPQLESAKASVLSAQAQLEKAKLKVERTKIIAPYHGRILKKQVDLGQVVSSNSQLASIYAVDYVEVRLPIKNKDLPLIELPEEYQNTNNVTKSKNKVSISSDLIGKQFWQGEIIRTESAIDESSQQLYVIAQITRPYERMNQGGQIKIGQYVTAKIMGNIIENSLVIPSSTIYQGSYVYIVENGLLMRKNVKLGWQNGTESIVLDGINAGDELVLTSLGQVSSGTAVSIEGQEVTKNSRSKKGAKKMPKERREKLEKMAEAQGITVEELLEKRKHKKPNTMAKGEQ